MNSCPASHAARAWDRLTSCPDAACAENLQLPDLRRLQPVRVDEVGREHAFQARRRRSGCIQYAHPALIRSVVLFFTPCAASSQMPWGALSRRRLGRRSSTCTKPTNAVRPAPLAPIARETSRIFLTSAVCHPYAQVVRRQHLVRLFLSRSRVLVGTISTCSEAATPLTLSPPFDASEFYFVCMLSAHLPPCRASELA